MPKHRSPGKTPGKRKRKRTKCAAKGCPNRATMYNPFGGPDVCAAHHRAQERASHKALQRSLHAIEW